MALKARVDCRSRPTGQEKEEETREEAKSSEVDECARARSIDDGYISSLETASMR